MEQTLRFIEEKATSDKEAIKGLTEEEAAKQKSVGGCGLNAFFAVACIFCCHPDMLLSPALVVACS